MKVRPILMSFDNGSYASRLPSPAESAELLAFTNRCQVAVGACVEAPDLPSWLAATWMALTAVPDVTPSGATVVATAILSFADRLVALGNHRQISFPIRGVARAKVIQALALLLRAGGHAASLEMLAAHVGVSGSHLSRIIVKETGYGFDTHLHGVRVLRASVLLRDSLCPMKQVADAAGYQNLTNFDRQFRRWLRMSPTDFRLASAPQW